MKQKLNEWQKEESDKANLFTHKARIREDGQWWVDKKRFLQKDLQAKATMT